MEISKEHTTILDARRLATETLEEIDEGRPEADRIVPLAQAVLFFLSKIKKLHDFVDLTNPDDPIGIALTRVGLDRIP